MTVIGGPFAVYAHQAAHKAVPEAVHKAAHGAVPENRVELSFGRTEDYDFDPPKPGTYRLPPIKEAADGQVLDVRGRSLSLRQVMDGRITVLAFIYTRCSDPQGCPLSLGLLYDLEYVARKDPVIGRNLRLIALSFDPGHDTPEVLAEYHNRPVSASREASDLQFLTTRSEDQIRPILEAYNQPVGRKTNPDDGFGPLAHQLRVYLIDRQARIRNIYSLGFLDPRLVITDIRALLLEERGEVTTE